MVMACQISVNSFNTASILEYSIRWLLVDLVYSVHPKNIYGRPRTQPNLCRNSFLLVPHCNGSPFIIVGKVSIRGLYFRFSRLSIPASVWGVDPDHHVLSMDKVYSVIYPNVLCFKPLHCSYSNHFLGTARYREPAQYSPTLTSFIRRIAFIFYT